VRSWLPAILVIGVLLVAWEVGARAARNPAALLPPPSQVATVLVVNADLFATNMVATFAVAIIGFLTGLAFGIVAAIAIVYSPTIERAVYPLLVFSQMVPPFAIAPLLVIWLGFGLEPRVVLVALIVFFPITVNMVAGLRGVDSGVIDLMRSYRATKWQIFRAVRLPNSLPLLRAGCQTGITYSVIGAVIAEWAGSQTGLGKLMIVQHSLGRTDRVLAIIVILGAAGVVLILGVRWVGRLLMPWERAASERS
jgi:NitT/TauT family transport system permease protein